MAVQLEQWWPDFFDRGPNLEIIFYLGPHALFNVTYLKVIISAKQKKIDLFDAYQDEKCTVFD